jgi:DNA-binding NarL/FixJ family response regulator
VEAISTLLATSSPALFERAVRSLRRQRDIALHPQPVSVAEALTIVRVRAFDVVMIDAEPYTESALEALNAICTLSPSTRLLLLRADWTEQLVVHVLRCGGAGCLPTDFRPLVLHRAIRAVDAGDYWTSRSAVASAFRPLSLPAPALQSPDFGSRGHLSPREREIVDWMRTGMSNKEIARKLGISDMTVKTHAHNIFNKLEVSGRLRLFGSAHATSPPSPRSS